MALGVCLVAGFMALLDVSIVNVALQSIHLGLGASDSDLQWVVSGYALAFGLTLVPAGRLGDARGRRTVFVVGVSLFTLSSLAAGLAPTPLLLVVARLLQGVGGGLLSPQMSAIIQELFRGAERGKAFGMLGGTIGVSTALGPILGGLIIGALDPVNGWRWIFIVNLPIGLATILLSFRFLPAPHPVRTRESRDLDPVGVILLGAGVLAILLPLIEQRDWQGPAKWVLLAAGVGLLVVLGFWERRYAGRGGVPLVDMELFGLAGYRWGAVLGMAYFSGFTGVLFVLSLYLQAGLGYSALQAGLTLTPFALASALGAMLGGRRVTVVGRRMVAAGLLIVIVGLVAIDLVIGREPGRVGLLLAVPLALGGFGSGLVISPNMTLTLTEVPVHRAGTAGGVLGTGQRIGTAAGIAGVGAVLFSTLSARQGDWTAAAQAGMRVALGLVCLALLVAALDLLGTRRREALAGLESRWSPP